ncbi:MAG: SIMPL domain-containing protein [Actinobacteria bacterium]|nr:SIMPL domain-containing protein [Actinomycetota bacterium]
MRKILALIAVGSLALAACSTGAAAASEPSSVGDGSAGINVTGQGKVIGTPDTLTLNLGVSVLRRTVDQATADAAAKAQAIVDALKAQGVAEEDIQTANYSIWPEYDYSGDTQTITGYRVQNELNVKIRDLDKAGATIDAATAAGGNDATVNGLSFSIEDNTALLEAARAAAWSDAEAKARQLSDLAGVQLGTARSITESISYDYPPVFYDAAFAEEAARESTPIQTGQQEVTVVIQVTFGIDS